jgi:hypothetical protein
MARIRSIKPEFPQSESMGRVSRDARLTFIQMWTIADDSGRLRGNLRMLASLLFPYDDDAPGLIESWVGELANEGCVVRYEAQRQSYIQIMNWSSHQKIDKPSASKIPPFGEPSRGLPEDSITLPVGEEGKGEEGRGEELKAHVPGAAGDDSTEPPKRPTKPDCPHQAIVDLYHELLPQCPQVRDWTPARQQHLRARWNEDPKRQNLDYWKRFFEYVESCDFLVGRSGKTPFFADLEWIVTSKNFTKIREERYANRKAA